MKNFPLLTVVALLGAAVSAPAQIKVEGQIGRAVRGSVVLGQRQPAGHETFRGPRDERGQRSPRGGEVRHEDRDRRPVRHLPPQPRGYWKTVCEEYLVPGYFTEEHVPPTFGWVYDHCGHRVWGVVDPGGCRQVWVPARWETRTRQVWVAC